MGVCCRPLDLRRMQENTTHDPTTKPSTRRGDGLQGGALSIGPAYRVSFGKQICFVIRNPNTSFTGFLITRGFRRAQCATEAPGRRRITRVCSQAMGGVKSWFIIGASDERDLNLHFIIQQSYSDRGESVGAKCDAQGWATFQLHPLTEWARTWAQEA